jgi:DNA polymerase III delta prime subunit
MVGHADHFAAANELVDEAWQGILQRPHLALFGGPPGVGKTTLAAHLIVALANPTGKPVDVLGYRVTPVPEGSFVVLVEEENGRRSIAKKLADSCDAYGLPVRETIDRIVTIPRSGFRVNSGSREHDGSPWYELRGRARDGLVGALFLDSWASTIRAESNSEEAQAEAAGWLRSFVELSGGPVVAVVHTRKGDPSSLDDIAGSHQRAAAADVILLVTAEKEGGAVLSSKITFAKLRDSEGEHPKPVSFSVARVEGHTRVALNGSARAEDMPAHERVFQCIQQGEKTRHQIRDALKMSGERVKQALDTLKAEKRMAWSKRTIGGRDTYFARAREVDPTAGLFKSAHTPPHEVQDDAF